jgi:hypothetical protein
MTIAADDAQQGASHRYQAMRDFVQSMDDTLGTTKAFRCSAWSTPARHPTPRPPTLNAWQKRPAPSPGGPSSPFPLFGTGPPVG